MTVIVLFDIDGTLTTGSGCGRHALEIALGEHLGVARALDGISLHGNIDWLIVKTAASAGGRWPSDREAQTALVRTVLASYREIFARNVGAQPYRALPSADTAVRHARERCDLVGLATGNIEACAHAKLASAGLGALFADCVGGYGDEAETRADVVRLAIERAVTRGARRGDVLLVGDTPLDVAAGIEAGARVACVATGRFTEAELRDANAHWVYPHLAALLEAPPW